MGSGVARGLQHLKDTLDLCAYFGISPSGGTFCLDVDASGHGAGAILHQYQSGELRVTAYSCRLFNQAERAYYTTGQELAAVMFGLEKFKQYVLGRRTIIRSDHAALSFLKHTKEPVAQQARWLDFIEQFDLKIEHRAGSSNRAAYVLSRRLYVDAGLCLQCSKRWIGWIEYEALYWRAAIIPSEGHVKVTTRGQASNTPRVCSQSEEASGPSDGSSRPSDGASGQSDRSSFPSHGTSNPSGGYPGQSDGAPGPGGGSCRPGDGSSGQTDEPPAPSDGSSRPSNGQSIQKGDRLLTETGRRQMGGRQMPDLHPRLFSRRKVRQLAGPTKSLSLYNVRMRRWELWQNGWKGWLGPCGRKPSRKIRNLGPTGFNGTLWSCGLGLSVDDSKFRMAFASICR